MYKQSLAFLGRPREDTSKHYSTTDKYSDQLTQQHYLPRTLKDANKQKHSPRLSADPA